VIDHARRIAAKWLQRDRLGASSRRLLRCPRHHAMLKSVTWWRCATSDDLDRE